MGATRIIRGLRRAGARALQRVLADGWPLLQRTGAATVAWLIAKYAVDHPEPFFAPIAAVVALNTSLGERGLNAVRLLQGVVLGIVVGELTLAVLGGSVEALALATFAAMAAARALGGARIAVAQAAVSAILIVSFADAEAGIDRLVDALIGAGVALVFSQVLFSPEPVRLLRRAEAVALSEMADGLRLSARALAEDDDDVAEAAIVSLRQLRDRLSELDRLRRASTRVARRSLVWRGQLAPAVQEKENAGHLDLLGGSCLILARSAVFLTPAERRELEPCVRDLAQALADLAGNLGERSARQRAVDQALDATRRIARSDAPADSALALAIAAVRIVATDLMVFAGVDLGDAVEAVRAGISEHRVPAPPQEDARPFSWRRWLRLPFEQRRWRRRADHASR
jgi:hypothetical protein